MTNATKLLTSATICGLLSLPLAFATCGGGSGGDRTGTGGAASGGTTGSGGSTGTGGRSGSGGAVGTGGATGTGGSAAPFSCMPGVSPANALLSDFSAATWSTNAGKWGMAGNLIGSIFSFKGPGVATVWNSAMVTNEALVLSGTVDSGDYAGGGMSFDQCVNTTAYTGIQFTLGGTTAGCDLYLSAQTFSLKPPPQGNCTTGCYAFPKALVPFGTAPITVRFSALLPAGTNPISTELVGLQWQLQSPPPPDSGLQVSCGNISMTIDNVMFVP